MTTDQTPDTGDGGWTDELLPGLDAVLSTAANELATLRQSLTEAEAETARLQSLNRMLGANVDALEAEVGRLREERAKDQAEMVDATEVINAAAALIPKLKAERDTLTARLDAADAVIATVAAFIAANGLVGTGAAGKFVADAVAGWEKTRMEGTNG